MQRWLVVLLVSLAVVVLISPGIVGRMAESNLEQSIEWAESENAGIEFQTESFDRGWFTSEGRHRVVLSGEAFRDAMRNYRNRTGHADLPTLVIDTRVDHGLVPVASLGRESASLAPGLASMVSTFQLDPGNGELMQLPATLYSNVGLTGATDSRFVLQSGDFQNDDTQVVYQGANIEVQTDRSRGALAVDGRLEPLTISDNDGIAHIGAVFVSADQVKSEFGFNVGTAAFSLESLIVESPVSPATIGNISFSADSSIADARLNIGSRLTIDKIVVPGMGDMDFALDVTLNRFDAASMQVITAAFKEQQGSLDNAMDDLFPQIEGDLQRLVSSGAEIRIEQLDVTLPQGTVTTTFNVAVPESDAGRDFAWSSVLLAMSASADVRMPVSLFEMLRMLNPQADALIAMGVLLREGDDYVMTAEYDQGALKINGAPMPIPGL